MARNEDRSDLPRIDVPALPPSGCTNYRMGLVLSALRRRLDDDLTDSERAAVEKEIEAMEEQLGF